MDDAELVRAHHRSHVEFFRVAGERGSPASQWIGLPGAGAAIVPATPERSLPNSVLYETPKQLLEHYDTIAAAYAAAGVRAFTVWVDPGDEPQLGPELEARGHVRDTAPMLQAARIADLDLEALAAAPLDLEPEPAFPVLARLNDRAWGLTPDGSIGAALAGLTPDGEVRLWIARHEGEPGAGLMVLVHDGDAYVTFVATDPRAAGRGLARSLLAHALLTCSSDGCITTTLEASAAGEPIYARMGYRSLHRIPMYERRLEPRL